MGLADEPLVLLIGDHDHALLVPAGDQLRSLGAGRRKSSLKRALAVCSCQRALGAVFRLLALSVVIFGFGIYSVLTSLSRVPSSRPLFGGFYLPLAFIASRLRELIELV